MNLVDKKDAQDSMKPNELLTGSIIGCGFDVLNELGSGFLESVYFYIVKLTVSSIARFGFRFS